MKFARLRLRLHLLLLLLPPPLALAVESQSSVRRSAEMTPLPLPGDGDDGRSGAAEPNDEAASVEDEEDEEEEEKGEKERKEKEENKAAGTDEDEKEKPRKKEEKEKEKKEEEEEDADAVKQAISSLLNEFIDAHGDTIEQSRLSVEEHRRRLWTHGAEDAGSGFASPGRSRRRRCSTVEGGPNGVSDLWNLLSLSQEDDGDSDRLRLRATDRKPPPPPPSTSGDKRRWEETRRRLDDAVRQLDDILPTEEADDSLEWRALDEFKSRLRRARESLQTVVARVDRQADRLRAAGQFFDDDRQDDDDNSGVEWRIDGENLERAIADTRETLERSRRSLGRLFSDVASLRQLQQQLGTANA